MGYLKIDENTFIQYDLKTMKSEIIIKNDLEKEILVLDSLLKEIPLPIPDFELLKWAKENYPMMDYTAKINQLEIEKNILEIKLNNIIAQEGLK